MARTGVKDSQDIVLQDLMNDIVRGARSKMVDPIIDENKKLGKLLEDLHDSSRKEFASVKERIDGLEEAVRAMPLLMLNAIREAISQAGMDEES